MDEQRKQKLQTEIYNLCEGLTSNARASSGFQRIQTLAQTLGQEPYVVSITSGGMRDASEEIVELKKELKTVRASLTKATKKLTGGVQPAKKAKPKAKPTSKE